MGKLTNLLIHEQDCDTVSHPPTYVFQWKLKQEKGLVEKCSIPWWITSLRCAAVRNWWPIMFCMWSTNGIPGRILVKWSALFAFDPTWWRAMAPMSMRHCSTSVCIATCRTFFVTLRPWPIIWVALLSSPIDIGPWYGMPRSIMNKCNHCICFPPSAA